MTGFDPAQMARDRVDERTALRRLARIEQRARLILIFETLWPSLVVALSLFGAIFTLILIGAFELLPPAFRGLTLVAVMGAASALLIRNLWQLHITREDTLDRIDHDTALAHRPALSLADFSASHLDDPLTYALWRAHRDQVTAKTSTLRVARPHPRVLERDPYALRFAVLLALIAAILVTGSDGMRRIDSALIWSAAGEAALQARVDGWIDPPAYTGLPPILFDFRSGTTGSSIRAPVGSTLVLRRSDDAISLPGVSGKLTAQENKSDGNEERFTIEGDAIISATGAKGRDIAIVAIPDQPPTVTLRGQPQMTASGGVTLTFHVEDDYGIASGTTRMINPRMINPRIGDRPLLGQHEPLVDAPNMAVGPSGDRRNSDGRVTFEANENPWAGATVDMALMVKDDVGQIAEAGMFSLRLPARVFTMPLARALIEERQRLALDPARLPRVRESIDLLMIAPELFAMPASDYLALREIRSSLDDAESEDDLKAIVDLMWTVALAIEKGGSDDTEKALNAAQEALRQALENGASDDEIRALTDKLKDALDAYLKDYAARAMKQMEQSGTQGDPSPLGRAIRPEDLKSMLDQMQNMAKNGARDDASRMLDALGTILKNLQASRPRLGNPSQNKNAQSLQGLDKMLRDQRGLRDDTFRQGRDNPDAGNELGTRQNGLRNDLGKLQDMLKGFDEDGQNAIGNAGEAMQRAEESLKQGDIAGALREQNKALEGLRAGAQALAKSMQSEDDSNQESGNQAGEKRGRFGQSSRQDPLGRETGQGNSDDGNLNDDANTKGAGDRARNVLNELRKRLGEDERTKSERDYYRRLIGPN